MLEVLLEVVDVAEVVEVPEAGEEVEEVVELLRDIGVTEVSTSSSVVGSWNES